MRLSLPPPGNQDCSPVVSFFYNPHKLHISETSPTSPSYIQIQHTLEPSTVSRSVAVPELQHVTTMLSTNNKQQQQQQQSSVVLPALRSLLWILCDTRTMAVLSGFLALYVVSIYTLSTIYKDAAVSQRLGDLADGWILYWRASLDMKCLRRLTIFCSVSLFFSPVFVAWLLRSCMFAIHTLEYGPKLVASPEF